ncbi:hypothetical protein [uncultured Clostridium sp.]|uniref:hypothetical protein n=1 Tax=uncultured Clostridium sp. TaxID=59620 RepID=UPI0025E47434|nr:hypothetical protein [uncultured Clostridium sp.]
MDNFTQIQNEIIRTDKLDVYQKSFINNILSNDKDFNISIKELSNRIPCSKDKCVKTINSLKELNILKVKKVKSPCGDWDSNSYKIELNILLQYIGVVFEKDNVVFKKDNSSISERQQVVFQKVTKNTNKNTNKNIKKEKGTSLDEIINSYTQNKELINTIQDFLKMRKAIKKPMTDRALNLMLKKLNGFSNNYEIQIKILEQSILNSWQGIFPLEEKHIQKNVKCSNDNKVIKLRGWD